MPFSCQNCRRPVEWAANSNLNAEPDDRFKRVLKDAKSDIDHQCIYPLLEGYLHREKRCGVPGCISEGSVMWMLETQNIYGEDMMYLACSYDHSGHTCLKDTRMR